METIQGTIETISKSFNGGWRIASVHPHGTVTGHLPGSLNPGDYCTFGGKWTEHQKYGKQFAADFVQIDCPRDIQGIKKYLARHYQWVGDKIANEMVRMFGDTLFIVIEQYPEKLEKIPGITPARAKEIHEKYLSIRFDQEQDVFFATNGITLNMQEKLVNVYRSKKSAIQAIKENPYQLDELIWGVGFKKCDAIAIAMGIKKSSPFRLKSGILWTLKNASESDGHCYLPEDYLLARAAKSLDTKATKEIAEELNKLVEAEDVVLVDGNIYRPINYRYEINIADKLLKLCASGNCSRHSPMPAADDLDRDQQQALNMALSTGVSIITGGPGVGKTYTIKRILDAFGYDDKDISLAAPTGKAAKRMSELTGQPAKTIHRLLEYNFMDEGFRRNDRNPLESKLLIIDETSMIDIGLMSALLDAINPSITQVIFVGDVDQLPSVGPGRLLADMIESGKIPTARLRTLHRQAASSLININAQLINKGEDIRFDNNSKDSDFIYLEEDDPEKIQELCLKVTNQIPIAYPDYSINDIQVLCPQKRGPIGTIEMNSKLRPYLNPRAVDIKGIPYKINDRVIQLRNNYTLEIFNGDVGTVVGGKVEFRGDHQYLDIMFDDRVIPYPVSDLDELALAYALTIHKSQGSEFLVVIIPLHTTNYMMLRRNLLYTGITRGKCLVVLVGSRKALGIAIRTVDSGGMNKRYTGIKDLLIKN